MANEKKLERCPSCGSDDPKMPWCSYRHHPKTVHLYVRHECIRCSDPFHSVDSAVSAEPSNVAAMPLNRDCKKCGWVHATGTECPAPDAMYGAPQPAATTGTELDWPKERQRRANSLLRLLSRDVFEDGIDIEKLPEAVGLVEGYLDEARLSAAPSPQPLCNCHNVSGNCGPCPIHATPSPQPAQQTDVSRCAICAWPLMEGEYDETSHCKRGDCSMRPFPKSFYDYSRACKEYRKQFDESYRPAPSPQPLAGQWISVKAELPTQDGGYLVWSKNCIGAYPMIFSRKSGKWTHPEILYPQHVRPFENLPSNPVTHWMPMLKAPQETL